MFGRGIASDAFVAATGNERNTMNTYLTIYRILIVGLLMGISPMLLSQQGRNEISQKSAPAQDGDPQGSDESNLIIENESLRGLVLRSG